MEPIFLLPGLLSLQLADEKQRSDGSSVAEGKDALEAVQVKRGEQKRKSFNLKVVPL